jgi:HEAT repeat protein
VQNPDWLEKHLTHPDARVRANVIEAMWAVASRFTKDIYRRALSDQNNRVVGNALLGLYRQSPLSSFPQIIKVSCSSCAPFRATAAWVMGQTGDERFLDRLQEMLTETEESVLRVVRRSIELIRG